MILPDVRGLYRFYEELALRFAERGYAALAIDYFGRTAGVSKREDDWDYMKRSRRRRRPASQADARAAVERLRAEGCTAIFTVGFCFGGSNSWLRPRRATASPARSGSTATRRASAAASRASIARVGEMECPILALQAGDDSNITAEDNAAFEEALTNAGVEHEIVAYDGAPHSFFDRKQEECQNASDDAWSRTLSFIAH